MDPLASIPSSITYEGGDLRGTISPGESTDKNDGPASSECPTLASTALNSPHPVARHTPPPLCGPVPQDHREGGGCMSVAIDRHSVTEAHSKLLVLLMYERPPRRV